MERKRYTTRSEEIPESGTVTVCCNIPNGLVLRTFDMVDDYEPVLGGGQRKIQRAEQRDTIVTLNGPKFATGSTKQPQYLIVDGYALTPNIDAQFFALWLEQNKNAPYVKNGSVCALNNEASAKDWAEEHAANKSGLEPLDMGGPGADKRIPKNVVKATKD
jgi:hypothetical protein